MFLFNLFQVEEEASDKDNKNCSNNGKQLRFILLETETPLQSERLDFISRKYVFRRCSSLIDGTHQRT